MGTLNYGKKYMLSSLDMTRIRTLMARHYGSQAELARRLGISKHTIGQWFTRKFIPAESARMLYDFDNRFKLWDLRPDLWPPHEMTDAKKDLEC